MNHPPIMLCCSSAWHILPLIWTTVQAMICSRCYVRSQLAQMTSPSNLPMSEAQDRGIICSCCYCISIGITHAGADTLVHVSQDALPGDAFALSLNKVWEVIRSQKDLNLPAHKVYSVLVAVLGCGYHEMTPVAPWLRNNCTSVHPTISCSALSEDKHSAFFPS